MDSEQIDMRLRKLEADLKQLQDDRMFSVALILAVGAIAQTHPQPEVLHMTLKCVIDPLIEDMPADSRERQLPQMLMDHVASVLAPAGEPSPR